MWAEFIVPRDDLERLLLRAVPLTIHPEGVDVAHAIEVSEISEVTLVADLGLRVVGKALIRWPVLGITVPIALKSLALVLLPSIRREPQGDVLAFRLSLDHADFSALPSLIDGKLTDAINGKLAAKGAELSWDFTTALSCVAPLPALLEPLESFAIKPAWGKVRITEEAIVYAVSFHSTLVRRGESLPDEFARPVL